MKAGLKHESMSNTNPQGSEEEKHMNTYTEAQIRTAYALAAFEEPADYRPHYRAFKKLLESYKKVRA